MLSRHDNAQGSHGILVRESEGEVRNSDFLCFHTWKSGIAGYQLHGLIS